VYPELWSISPTGVWVIVIVNVNWTHHLPILAFWLWDFGLRFFFSLVA
jgi:hypothetical protein